MNMSAADPIEAMLLAAGIAPDHTLREVLAGRQDIFEGIATTEKAALRPDGPGGISHDQRAALAARMARLNGEAAMADHYAGQIQDAASVAAIAEPHLQDDANPRLQAILRHVDLVTSNPKDASRVDIEALKAQGLADADVVRLSELIAFVNFQLRVVAGLRLMGGSS